MDLPAILQVVEQSCKEFQIPTCRAQAEHTLLEFRKSPQAFEASKYILQNSHDVQAQFQAILALRHAVLANWTNLSKDSQMGTVQFLVQYTMHHAAQPVPLVQTQCAATAAALIKRAWEDLSEAERQAVMQGIDATAAQAGTPHARRASLQLLTAVVQEFSPATASPLSLPWDHHERCRSSLEGTFLQGIFLHAMAAARESAAAAAAGAEDGGLCLAALQLLCAILSWDFSTTPGSSWAFRSHPTSRPNEITHVRPPPSWAEALLSPQSVDWLEGLVQATRGPQKSGTPLAAAARQLLCLLCSLAGGIFPRQPQAEDGVALAGRAELGLNPARHPGPQGPKDFHLQRMLRMLLPLVTPPAAAVHAALANDESELLDACRGLLAAAAVHRGPGFERAAAGMELPVGGGVLGVLAELTQAVLGAGGGGPDAGEEGWCSQAADLLMEVWVELLADPCRGPLGLSPAAVGAAGAVFIAVMESSLKAVAASAHEDAEDEQGGEGAVSEDWLDRVAAVGRAAAPTTLPAMTHRLQQCQAELAACWREGRDPSATLEQLCWVVSMAAHVLADAGEGEVPLVPPSIQDACTPAWAGGGVSQPAGGMTHPPAPEGDCVLGLSQSLVGVGRMCLEESARPVISPRLMEVVVTSLGRWGDTYLLPASPVSPAMDAAFSLDSHFCAELVKRDPPQGMQGHPGCRQGGMEVLEALVKLLLAALTQFPGERTLHELACLKLLNPITRDWISCRSLLAASPSWAALVKAVGEGAPGILQLDTRVQRRVTQGICLAVVGFRADDGASATANGQPSQEASRQYIHHVLQYTVQQLQVLGAAGSKAALQGPGVVVHLAGLVESMRGVARGVIRNSARRSLQAIQEELFSQFTLVADALVLLLRALSHHPALVALILKLGAELAEGVVGGLSPRQASQLFAWALQLIRAYAELNLGQLSVQAGPSLKAEQEAERYADLRALLKLLTNLSHRDWWGMRPSDALGGNQPSGDDVVQVVFAGLDIILPLISVDLLKYPKLGRQYFSLLADMSEVYPERVATLPPRIFHALLSTLQFGVGMAGDAEISEAVFESVAVIAKYHAVEVAGGRAGLGPNNASPTEGGPTAISSLLTAILERLLSGEEGGGGGQEAVDYAAEALLPLILGEPSALQGAGEGLVGSLPSQEAKDKVTRAFWQLTDGLERSLDRSNRARFRTGLVRFVADVRGAVRLR